jgi:hypothetical protein
VAWQTPLWDPLSPTQAPAIGQPAISVTMMQNEYRAGAFNLSNATASDITVYVNIQQLPGGTNPSYVTVQNVLWTDTEPGVPVAAALPDAASDATGYVITVPSGMTRQVWLTFHPAGIAAGTYTGTVAVSGQTGGPISVPVTLRLSALPFPAQPTLSLSGWDYTDADIAYGVTPQNRDALIALLGQHFVDTTWGTAGVMPMNTDLQASDFAAFDAWVSRWPGARNYRVFLNVGNTFGSYSMGTAGFNAAVGAWIASFATHWQQIGLSPSQIGLQLTDVPQTPEDSATVIAWASAIHAAVPQVRIVEDPAYSDPTTGTSMFDVCDILYLRLADFVNGDDSYRNVYLQQQNAGKTLVFYSCDGPSRLKDPYSYYRLQSWTCWSEGAAETAFWAFGDNGFASSWNEYLTTRNDDTPVYLDGSTVTEGKQMAALREGVEDYEYLVMMKNRIAALQGTGNPQVAAAQTLLDQAAGNVLNATGANGTYLYDDKDRTVADQVRIEMLNMLEALQAVAGTPSAFVDFDKVGPGAGTGGEAASLPAG